MALVESRKKCKLTQREAAELTKTSLRSCCSYEKDEDATNQLKLQRIKENLEDKMEGDASCLKDKVLLITGGIGSFGKVVLNHLLTTVIGEIRIFSCDEK